MDCSYRVNNVEAVEVPRQQLFPDHPLPEEVVFRIFSYLKGFELGKCCRVSQGWHRLAKDNYLWHDIFKDVIFAEKDCEKFFGKITKPVPPLPKDYIKILYSPDPNSPTQRTMQNWMLLLMPEEIDGKPLDLETMRQLVTSKNVHKVGYRFIWDGILKKDKEIPIEKSYWILKRKNIVPDSKSKAFEAQEKLVQNYGTYAKVPTIREEVFFNFAVYAKFSERPYGDNPRTYGRCIDIVNDYRVVVGHFSHSGLDIERNCFTAEFFGVGARRKFSNCA